jgi:hypothetical protein
MSRDRDEQFFMRFRTEQLEELVYYLEDEEKEISGEVITHVRAEEFTKASMATGELDWVRTFRRRTERAIQKRKESN